MDKESIKRMSHSLKAYSKVRGGLRKMTKEELADIRKKVLIACASNEIVYVWKMLPRRSQEDPEISKYRFCEEHGYDHEGDNVNDGPPPRKLFCCYCKLQDTNVANNNKIERLSNNKMQNSMTRMLCCSQ